MSGTSEGRSSAFPLEGNEYTLTCTVSGDQSLASYSVTYQWSRDSGTVQGQMIENRLVFNPVEPDDNGTYTCRATVSSSLLNGDITVDGSTAISVTGTVHPCFTNGEHYLFLTISIVSTACSTN